jgi:putative transcriptional regulator
VKPPKNVSILKQEKYKNNFVIYFCIVRLTSDVKRTILFLCKACYTISKGCDRLQTKILELRKARKVTQNELADAVNVTRQTIISLENGKYNASLVLAHKIAQFFNVAIEDIFIFDEEDENI